MNADTSKKIMDFTKMISDWMNKKVSIVSFGRHDLEIRTEVGQMFTAVLLHNKDTAKIYAFVGKREGLTKSDYASVLNQWTSNLTDPDSQLKIGGTFHRHDLVAADSGLGNDTFLNSSFKPLKLDRSTISVLTLSSKGVICRSSSDVNEFLNETSKMSEGFFSYIDAKQIQAMLTSSIPKMLNTVPVKDGGFLN